ncbi:ABC transporter ATP-binding protein [Bacillus sp. FJAT-50079]|uniref:ABC transporter ATP-binding protein n=1 Tax=Bacillus sp. FJAT-50079 TaxID=2833577 RepID=UPI001BC9E85F|nr:ABC transporter ATP-binding protein [Bacillus sp. FJAT-50079]MBS4208172.1 ABC transporter ATP-binding protein [Bacillus sp. FJAT-50079]
MRFIQFANVSKQFERNDETFWATRNINLEVEKGEFLTVIGPSGCGKSTLLNMCAGIMEATEGTIIYDGKQVEKVNTKVGYMTQKDNLLPWRSVTKNVELGLEIQGVSRKEREKTVRRYIEMVGLDGFENHYPQELSGGMRKRVSLAQLLAYNPETLLLDEPFGALDAQLRLIMQDKLLDIWKETKKTIIFVTHDLDEAVTLGDRVAVFSKRPGTIKLMEKINIPRPRDVYNLRLTNEFMKAHATLWNALKDEFELEVSK